MYDLPSSNTFGPSHHMSSSSTSSLTGFGLGGGGGGHLTPMPGSSGDHNKQPNPNTNLIINYLPQDMNERELHSLFSAMGPVDTVRVMRDLKVSGVSSIYQRLNILH
jgi:protein sex-lethal